MAKKVLLKSKNFEGDAIEIDLAGVKIYQELESGLIQGFFLSHDALEEIITNVMKWANENAPKKIN